MAPLTAAPTSGSLPQFWAKTITGKSGAMQPGISVRDHCINVGCVASQLLAQFAPGAKTLLPSGSVTLAALHDIGKITLGFLAKCPAWLQAANFDDRIRREILQSVTDHALVSQWWIKPILKARGKNIDDWAIAVGAHHGKPKGKNPHPKNNWEALQDQADQWRHTVLDELIAVFGPLPSTPPDQALHDTDLWLLAGLITVADWIGSNERFFSPANGQPFDQTRTLAADALRQIGWPGGRLTETPFPEAFGFQANTLQKCLVAAANRPGVLVVEAPMGFGKTEGALAVAQRLIASGQNNGLYFALPTQVTSNRIHLRVGRFLERTLADHARLRLVHGNSWLADAYDLEISPAYPGGPDVDNNPRDTVTEARSWFASSKQALLAPYGVGTIDQALQGVVAVKHFFVRRFALAGKVVILDEIHSYDLYTGTLVTALVRELIRLGSTVIILSATLTAARRRELLAAAGCCEETTPDAYPLISVGNSGGTPHHLTPSGPKSRKVHLLCKPIADEVVIAQLIARAEAGQHVLWIRNTVIEAQEAYRHLRSELCEGDIALGLIHSRFPLQRREQLEEDWLTRLGRDRANDGPGSILLATQVVEQSVDIDLDFIVSDLAPTDMLLQRMGRLWRHPRERRATAHPEFWIRFPTGVSDQEANPKTLTKSLGRSGRVYAPWVLLRSARVFAERCEITLPSEIRTVLESTYAAPTADEPAAWHELHGNLEMEKDNLQANAEAVMRVLGQPTLTVEEHSHKALTRREGAPTVPVVLLGKVELLPTHRVRLSTLDRKIIEVSDYEWDIEAARLLHRWLVRVPKWQVPQGPPKPHWLHLHVPGNCTFATISEDDGRLYFDDIAGPCGYRADLGVYALPLPSPSAPRSPHAYTYDDDDEFDY